GNGLSDNGCIVASTRGARSAAVGGDRAASARTAVILLGGAFHLRQADMPLQPFPLGHAPPCLDSHAVPSSDTGQVRPRRSAHPYPAPRVIATSAQADGRTPTGR